MCPAQSCARRTAPERLLLVLRSLDQDNPPYTPAACELAGGGSAKEESRSNVGVGIGGPPVFVAIV